jgi:protein-disulfide isomerase
MSQTISIRKDSLWKYTTFILAAVLIVGAFVFFLGDNPATGRAIDDGIGQVSIDEDDDAFLGKEDAPVTIIEFSDYECPFCGRHFQQTFPLIKTQYIETGKVKYVFRDLPLSGHPNAQKAAEAAECVRDAADSDEAYFEMHDLLFENQQRLNIDNLKSLALEIGYDISDCLDSGKFASEVAKDKSDARAAGGGGTPYFIINGKPLTGAQPFQVFKQVIDAELS